MIWSEMSCFWTIITTGIECLLFRQEVSINESYFLELKCNEKSHCRDLHTYGIHMFAAI